MVRRRFRPVVASFDDLGLKPGDHIVTVLQNRWEAATLHWACQFAGIVITPVNWRAKADETRFLHREFRGLRAIVYEDVSRGRRAALAAGTAAATYFASMPRPRRRDSAFADADRGTARRTPRRASAPTPGRSCSTPRARPRKPKGVPRRHRAERAAAIAHVAQNLYGRGERTLGVMPLYHTMGVRSLLAMSLIGGTFVCLPRYRRATGAGADRAASGSPISIWCRRSITTSSITSASPRPMSPACASSALPVPR